MVAEANKGYGRVRGPDSWIKLVFQKKSQKGQISQGSFFFFIFRNVNSSDAKNGGGWMHPGCAFHPILTKSGVIFVWNLGDWVVSVL